MTSYNILIICWDFPLNKAIGGRRWAKMAKSFLKQGCKVSVLNKKTEICNEDPAWIGKDIYSKLEVHSLEENTFVKWLNDYSSSLRSVKIRIAKGMLSIISKGTIFDKSIGIEKQFLQKASDIIKKNKIDLVCVTGAPFNLLYYASKLKMQFPHVKIVADYRDPWINAQNYGMRSLSYNRKSYELKKQDNVFDKVDHVTAPNAFLLNEIKTTHTGKGNIKALFTELPHAFDPDDVVKPFEQKTKSRIEIIYAGALYIGCEPYLELLNDSVRYAKNNTHPKFSIRIYTDDVIKGKVFEQNSDTVQVLPSIHSKVFDKVNESDFIIILLSEHNKNYVTSKFYEFLPYRKPFLYLGPKGHVHDKILNEKLGYCLSKKEDLASILKVNSQKEITQSDLSFYTFDQTAERFLMTVMDKS